VYPPQRNNRVQYLLLAVGRGGEPAVRHPQASLLAAGEPARRVAGGLLLGQSFLSRFKSWSIDNQRQALFFFSDGFASSTTSPRTGTKLAKAKDDSHRHHGGRGAFDAIRATLPLGGVAHEV
jgi:hypothetical protein